MVVLMGKEVRSVQNIVIIRRYEPIMPDDLHECLRLVYEPWIDAIYNGSEDVHANEESDDECRIDNPSFDVKATQRNFPTKAT
jgi:hypothetical protein